MIAEKKNKRVWVKRVLIIGAILFVVGGIAAWFIFTQEFSDTTKQDAAYTLNAIGFIKEFQASDSLANKKYVEKIITIRGRISEMEAADTTVNIKMIDTLTDAYIIFAFQQQHLAEAKQLKEGDSVSIKGSCSGGTYSEILETQFITFKRCAVIK
jgi:tRNA_anti-like